MAASKSQFEKRLENWAEKNGVEKLINNKDVFVHMDKYNKPIDKNYVVNKTVMEKLSKEDKAKLESLKKKLPYEELYFSVQYSQKNNVFFVVRKTPIQSMLNVWAIVLIIWAIYRWYFKTSLPLWVDEFIAKPAVFFIPVVYYITRIEKKNFFQGIGLKEKVTLPNILIGLFVGSIFFIAGGINYFSTHSSFSSLLSGKEPLLLLTIVAFATSISEEMLSRGFVLKRLYDDSQNLYTSSIFTSILFFFMHIPILFTNQNFFGPVLLQVMAIDFLLSMAVSFLFIQSRTLVLPILVHALYNISLYVFSSSK
jgi:membrane protease YdiL (CAAX protease family)